MTRRERKENRLQRRLDWADSREAKAAAKFEAVRKIADNIPLGQPILIGHHSEKHARKDQERMHNGMAAGVESSKMAEHHRSVAGGIADQLDRSIFSDDDNAVEALQDRIAELEAKRARMVLVNKLFKKKDGAGLAELGLDLAKLTARLEAAGGYWGKAPHLPYEMSNLGGRIQADKRRLEQIKAQQGRAEQATAAGGLLVQYEAGQRLEVYSLHCYCASLADGRCDFCTGTRTPPDDEKRGRYIPEPQKYIRLTFEDKPSREILNALRAAGFYWGAGRWTGETAKLPAGILPEVAP